MQLCRGMAGQTEMFVTMTQKIEVMDNKMVYLDQKVEAMERKIISSLEQSVRTLQSNDDNTDEQAQLQPQQQNQLEFNITL